MKSFLHSRALGCSVGVAIPVHEQHHWLLALRISLSCSVYVFFFFCTSLSVGKTNVSSVLPFHEAHSSVRYSEYNGSKMNTFVSNLQSMQPAKMNPSTFNCMLTLHVGRVGPVNFYPKIYLPNAYFWTVGESQSSRKRTHSNLKPLCEATAARVTYLKLYFSVSPSLVGMQSN